MKRIQIGNDFRVSWTLTQLGEAFSLKGKEYEIEVSSPYGVILVSDVVSEDNILSFGIHASQQVYLGNYDILLKITDEAGQTWRLKQCDAFALVPCDCGEIVEVVQFASGIVYPTNGLDAYQLAVASGKYTGDYEGYQRWLARYAESTANDAVNIANEANSKADGANENSKQAVALSASANENSSKALTLSQQASEKSTNAEEKASEAETLAKNAAQQEGIYPNLTSGFADNLVGRGEATPEVFTFRQSGGNTSINDGTARLKSIKGNSVVFNQLFLRGANSNYYQWEDSKVTINGTITSDYETCDTEGNGAIYSLANDHILLVTIKQLSGKVTNGEVQIRVASFGANKILTITPESSNAELSFIGKYLSSGKYYTRTKILANTTVDNLVLQYQIFDLTAMFGAGNEPQTVEEFRSLYPNDYYEYNAGEIINSDYMAIESVGFNAFDGEKADVIGGKVYELLGNYTSIGFTSVIGGELTTIEIPEDKHYTPSQNGYIYAVGSDVCIHLCHTGYKDGKYEPYIKDVINLPNIELKKAGNVYDEVRYNPNSEKWEYVHRVGSVDMGELNWVYYTKPDTTAYPYGYLAALVAGRQKGIYNILCSKYAYSGGFTVNNNIFGNSASTGVYIIDSNYTDGQVFKEAMKGQILQYELAEPIITELEGDYSTDYIVSDFGTEKAITDKLCAPFSADIIYQFNAVDRIGENSAKIAKLEALIVELNSKLLAQEASVNNINIEEE